MARSAGTLRPWKTAHERLRLWTAGGTWGKTLAEVIVRDHAVGEVEWVIGEDPCATEMTTVAAQEVSWELTTRMARTAAVIWRRHDGLETAAGPPRDTFGWSVSPSARNRPLPAALQLRGWDSNPQPTD
jgi:hypothetical protein